MIQDARAPEETVLHLPPVVLSQRSSGTPPTRVQQAGMPNGAAQKDAGELACEELGVRCRLPHSAARSVGTTAGAIAFAATVEPTPLGSRERRVRAERF
jgi:hypothetical protein